MTAELAYVPLILLLGLGILLIGVSGSHDSATKTVEKPLEPAQKDVLVKTEQGDSADTESDPVMTPLSPRPKDPVIIFDYEDGKSLIVELPDTLIDDMASAELSPSGLDTEIKVGPQVIAILRGYTNVDAVDAQFVLRPAQSNGGEARVIESIEAGDDVMIIADFDVTEDTLEVAAGGALTFAPTNKGADTLVLIDGGAVFHLKGVTPAAMAAAKVTVAA